jgi:hypothetical protein
VISYFTGPLGPRLPVVQHVITTNAAVAGLLAKTSRATTLAVIGDMGLGGAVGKIIGPACRAVHVPGFLSLAKYG